jgi:hypothetical protein
VVLYVDVHHRFYTCAPARTERLVVRHDDRTNSSNSDNSQQHPALLVREGGSQRGRDEPALAMKHCIDSTLMQV